MSRNMGLQGKVCPRVRMIRSIYATVLWWLTIPPGARQPQEIRPVSNAAEDDVQLFGDRVEHHGGNREPGRERRTGIAGRRRGARAPARCAQVVAHVLDG